MDEMRVPEIGQRVTLRENAEEGWVREEGVVTAVTDMPWGQSIVVEIDPQYRATDAHDDGLREVDVEQIETIYG